MCFEAWFSMIPLFHHKNKIGGARVGLHVYGSKLRVVADGWF